MSDRFLRVSSRGRHQPTGSDNVSRGDRRLESDPIDIVVVTSSACHLCVQAKDVLGRLADDYDIAWTEVDMESEEGESIVRASRAPFPPMIVVGGEFYGYGRLSEKKLRKDLERIMKET